MGIPLPASFAGRMVKGRLMGRFGRKMPGAGCAPDRRNDRVLRISSQFINALLGMRAAILAEAVNVCFALL
jgi:hypothetical protein